MTTPTQPVTAAEAKTPRTDEIAETTWQEGEVVPAEFARRLERELNNYKHLYEQQAKSNAWQAEVIELAEELFPEGVQRQEYMRRKWESKP